MKVLRKDEYKAKAKKLSEYIQKRRDLEKMEKELKEEFKGLMGDDLECKVGDYLMLLTEKTRKSLDKKKLVAKLGADKVKAFESETTYYTFDIKQAA